MLEQSGKLTRTEYLSFSMLSNHLSRLPEFPTINGQNSKSLVSMMDTVEANAQSTLRTIYTTTSFWSLLSLTILQKQSSKALTKQKMISLSLWLLLQTSPITRQARAQSWFWLLMTIYICSMLETPEPYRQYLSFLHKTKSIKEQFKVEISTKMAFWNTKSKQLQKLSKCQLIINHLMQASSRGSTMQVGMYTKLKQSCGMGFQLLKLSKSGKKLFPLPKIQMTKTTHLLDHIVFSQVGSRSAVLLVTVKRNLHILEAQRE